MFFKKKKNKNLEDYAPEIYAQEEMEAVEAHIAARFGDFANVFHEIVSPDIHCDICIIEPSEERDYYTFVTMGMGAHRMNVPEELREHKLERAELLICLPPDWEISNDDERWYWPIRLLKAMARFPGENDTWFGYGHSVAGSEPAEPYAENTELCGVMLSMPYPFGQEAAVCPLPDGSEVNFYLLLPIHQDEMEYKRAHCADDLEQLLDDFVVDPARKSVVAGRKDFRLQPSEIEDRLPDWQDAGGCLCTDRITVDGCKVGFMYREEPDEGVPDSGWRFFAGDEDDEYTGNPEHSGVYHLNTIANYDADVIPFLNAPYGSAFGRDENGAFREEPFEPPTD
ncbi:MAG: DUF2185 domain-containing protein [Clostridiales Family XIII bacterium]|jgi:hypothetical protein|nr:DUF2185 domain-containing protein [Clostridiales Family XIII bacterium]